MGKQVAAAALMVLAIDARASLEDVERGRKLFDSHCARCHGIGGTGGEGPSLVRPALPHAADDEALFGVIRDGIEGTAMPETWQISDDEVRRIVAYVRSLGRVAPTPLAGDRERGRILFEGKGRCSTCHVVKGQGGTLGPELTEVGLIRGAAHLRESLVAPAASVPPDYLPVRAVTGPGEEVTGVRVNEDSFTIQVRDASGRIHSLEKLELRVLEKKLGESLMPGFESDLTEAELDDVVAYLASLMGAN